MSSVVRPCALSLVWFLSLSAVAISKPDPLDRSADDVSVTRSSRPQPDEDAAVPRLVKFSGQLPLARTPNVSGTRLVTFALYAQEQGGEPLWSETQVVNVDPSGQYTVTLGATVLQGIPVQAFSSGEARWLGVTVEGEAEQVRMLLVSVPYALKAAEAEKLGGKSASDFVTKSDMQAALQSAVQQSVAQTILSVSGAQPSGGLDDSNHGNNALARVQPGVTSQGVTGAGATSFSDTSGNEVVFINQSGTGMAVNAATTGTVAVNATSSAATGTAVRGAASSVTGTAVGVRGDTAALNGQGVLGTATSLTGNTTGVQGQSSSATGTGVSGTATGASGVAVIGTASSPTGNTIGVEGVALSPTGIAGVFNVLQSGATIFQGQFNGQTKVTIDSQGNIVTSGTVTAAHFIGDGSRLTGVSGSGGGGNGTFTSGVSVTPSSSGTALSLNVNSGDPNSALIQANSGKTNVFTVNNNGGMHILSTDIVGANLPIEVDDNTTGMNFSGSLGDTLGRLIRLGDDKLYPNAIYDIGINQAGNLFFTNDVSNATEVLTLTQAGNIGIGTNNPSTALEVNGTVTAANFVGNGSGLTGINASGIVSTVSTATPPVVVSQSGPGAGITSTTSGAGAAVQAIATGGGTAGSFQSNATILQALNANNGEVFRADQGGIAIGQGQSISNHLSATATLQFPQGSTPGNCLDFPVVVPTAADGDTVAIGIPGSLANIPGLLFNGFVSSPGTVTVRGCSINKNTQSTPPPSFQVRVDVWKHSNAQDGTINGNQLQISPLNANFGTIGVGLSSGQLGILLSNIGNGSSSIGLSFGTLNSTEFSVVANTCSASLAANATCIVAVTFTPNQPGSRTATLAVTPSLGTPQTINLSGTGSGSPLLISPGSINFGPVALTTAATANLTLSNNSAGTITFSFSSLFAPFSFGTTSCSTSLAPNTSCTLPVKFQPTNGSFASQSVTFTDNSGNPPQTLNIQGSGGLPNANLSISSLSYGAQALSTQSVPQTVTLSNQSGNAALAISNISISGSDFVITGNSCGTSLPAAATCFVAVAFQPVGASSRSGTLTFIDNNSGIPGSQQIVSLFGTGNGPVSTLSTTGISYSTQAIGVPSSPQQLVLTNNGGGTLAISSIALIGTDFQISSNTCPNSGNVTVGTSCYIYITFTPQPSGTRAGTLTITSNTGGVPGTQQIVNLSGSGATPSLQNSGSLSFPTATLGTSPSPQTLLLKNVGGATLNFSAFTITGSADFAILQQGTSCAVAQPLAPGQLCNIMVNFTPQSQGGESATLNITSDNGGTPGNVVQIALSGNGGTPNGTITVPDNDFRTVPIGSTSSARQLFLTNTGGATLTITSISFDNPDFTIDQANSTCFFVTPNIAPRGSCVVTMKFTPSQSISEGATLTIIDNSGGNPNTQQTRGFSGNGGTANFTFQLDDSRVFSTGVGGTSDVKEVLVTNNGKAPLTFFSNVFVPATPAVFTVDPASTCLTLSGNQLPIGASCYFFVTYSPSTQAGNDSASLRIFNNSGGNQTNFNNVSLSGTVRTPGGTSVLNYTRGSYSLSSPAIGVPSLPQEEVVTNFGSSPITISSLTFVPANSVFSIFTDQPSCTSGTVATPVTTPITINPQQTCTFRFVFTSTAQQPNFSATLSVAENNQTATITLNGSTGTPSLVPSPSSIAFGTTAIGRVALPQQVELFNTGSDALTFSGAFTLTANPAGDFSENDNCSSGVPPGSSCLVTISFIPRASGTRTAVLNINSNNGGVPTLTTINLSGTGGVPNISGSSSIGFNNVPIGSTQSMLYTVSSIGNATLTINSIAITPAGSDFSIDATNSNCPTSGGTLAPGSYCMLTIVFTPTAAGTRTANLVFNDDDSGIPNSTQPVPISGGVRAPQISASPCCGIGFSTIPVGKSATPQTLALSNLGGAPLVISALSISPNTEFTLLNANACITTLAPNAFCEVGVLFTPSASGSRSATITVTDNDTSNNAGVQTIAVTGTGGTQSLGIGFFGTFNSPGTGLPSEPQQNTISNNGSGPLTITSIQVTAGFSQTNNCPAVLGAGQVCTINVTYTPTITGFVNGNIIVTSDTGGTPNTQSTRQITGHS